MSITRTYNSQSTSASLSEGVNEILTHWLAYHTVWQRLRPKRVVVNRANNGPRTDFANMACDLVSYRGATELAQGILDVIGLVLRPLGTHLTDVEEAVAELDRIRPTQNRVGRGREDWYPYAYARSRDPSKVAGLLCVVAGLPLADVRPPEERITAALARLEELEVAVQA